MALYSPCNSHLSHAFTGTTRALALPCLFLVPRATGVAQNSVLNGRAARELGFARVHVPSCPGDEGVAVGCALFGARLLANDQRSAHRRHERTATRAVAESAVEPAAMDAATVETRIAGATGATGAAGYPAHWRLHPPGKALSPYLGKAYTTAEVAAAMVQYQSWVAPVDVPTGERQLVAQEGPQEGVPSHAKLISVALKELRLGVKQKGGGRGDDGDGNDGPLSLAAAAEVAVAAARAIACGEIVAWFEGRSEFGPRALGGRSLLADPRNGAPAEPFLNLLL